MENAGIGNGPGLGPDSGPGRGLGLDTAPVCSREPGCITCSDEGIPMRVLAVVAAGELAECEDEAGRREEVLTGVVGDVVAGDVLLVHAGTALVRLTGAEEGA